ncbi:MAG: putative tRNA sulfurtransferase [Parcubacteria group bacterium ADurb.Bin247]|nr:MAG: putative tRNA sulfurtransferase [Parcubacteria group bacterium ADurb.Bin247]
MNFVICHYSEIALKGGNRSFFERKLVENIKKSINSEFVLDIKKISGRILIILNDGVIKSEIEESLKRVFGISNFLFCIKTKSTIEDISRELTLILEKEKFKTFRITAKRSEKNTPNTSQQINEQVGANIFNHFKDISVNLENPDINCFVEIVSGSAYISIKKIQGLNGLPVGTGGKVVLMLSGGIDSPVAGFMAMSRGLNVILVHFHTYPETSQNSIEKVKEISKILSKYQPRTKLYLVPFAKIQKQIFLSINPKLRVIFYRRLMFKIAQEIAKKEKALGIVTGESIGQVASQTLENINATQNGIAMPIIRPLICYHKDDIIEKARQIKTFDISILPHDDCCSRFLPKHPEIRAKIEDVLAEEKKLNIDLMIKEALNEIEKPFSFI